MRGAGGDPQRRRQIFFQREDTTSILYGSMEETIGLQALCVGLFSVWAWALLKLGDRPQARSFLSGYKDIFP